MIALSTVLSCDVMQSDVRVLHDAETMIPQFKPAPLYHGSHSAS